ncbi:endoribonuclease [Canna indica]|uniref:Endoribonuclease n=1 Tax=Canna indica TaxID=4628 RepID=A0AAQ3L747_9LILI|nr:endoribonuclease [Canna indica]
MAGASSPPLRWRSCPRCRECWVDPMEEEALRFAYERKSMEIELRSHAEDELNSGLQLGISNTKLEEKEERDGDLSMRTAKSQLLQICAVNCWSPPLFLLSEDGPDLKKRFTCKVKVMVDTITTTMLECFSEAKPQKQEAEEHAAEAALWILKHLGHSH